MHTQKRLYVGLLGGSLLFAIITLSMIWYLVGNRQLIVNQILLSIILAFLGGMALILMVGILSLVIMIARSKTIPSLENITQIANEILFPLTLITGKILGIQKENILRSFIEVNNYLVVAKRLFIPRSQVMILVPHCLQNSECQHKITVDINNCKGCGKCKMGDLKKYAEENHALLKVATGGTVARKYIQDLHPRGIVAIACERDLSSGIQDSGFIPIVGVLNCRPNGPCHNTDVDLEAVEAAFQCMCKGG
ncbi:MAG TPA: DUF116 domain-containing protein [Syntrophomonadaceae bacterium]|nr:DUF116 domain-containing protein [Syntrophomonadaceae bacterium]